VNMGAFGRDCTEWQAFLQFVPTEIWNMLALGTNSLIAKEISTSTRSDSRKYNCVTSLELQKVFITRIFLSKQAEKPLQAQFTEVLYLPSVPMFIGVE